MMLPSLISKAMKNLFKNIWEAPASTAAAAITAALGVFIFADIGMPKESLTVLAALSAGLSLFAGPNPKN
jgi:phosphate/sulfate permease